MNIKSFVKDSVEKEKSNHRIVNIMVIAILSMTILFTLCFGVKVDIGSSFLGGEGEAYVRQNIFKVAALVLDTDMTKEEAIIYVEEQNAMLKEKYGVLGFNTQLMGDSDGAFEKLKEFDDMVEMLGDNASKVNLLKYKFAFAVAIGNMDSLEHKMSFEGSRIYAMAGQLVLVAIAQAAFLAISIVMLVFAIMSLIKKTKFTKARFMFILLLICFSLNLVLFSSMSFVSMNWAGIIVMTIVPLGALLYCGIQYLLMDKRDFSPTMFLHNLVLTLGGLLALILFLSPLFNLTTVKGVTDNLGWAYLMDYRLTEMANMSAVMAYTLTEIIMIGFMMMPAILSTIFVLVNLARFMIADYQHNEKKVFIIAKLIISAIIILLVSVYSINGSLNISSLYITVKLNFVPVVLYLLTLGGLLAFEILYKVKPIKKELVIR